MGHEGLHTVAAQSPSRTAFEMPLGCWLRQALRHASSSQWLLHWMTSKHSTSPAQSQYVSGHALAMQPVQGSPSGAQLGPVLQLVVLQPPPEPLVQLVVLQPPPAPVELLLVHELLLIHPPPEPLVQPPPAPASPLFVEPAPVPFELLPVQPPSPPAPGCA